MQFKDRELVSFYPHHRLEAIRTSRLAINPMEEQALLSEAHSVAAARAGPAANPKSKPSTRGCGRARGRGRGGADARETPPAEVGLGAGASGQRGCGGGESGGPGVGGVGGAVKAEDPLAEGVRFCALEAHEQGLLWDLAPAFVVNYDPDIAFVRQLEVRRSLISENILGLDEDNGVYFGALHMFCHRG